jgi:putative ABC transport system permease protein
MESIRTAIRAIRKSGLRSWLTVLGIAIGVVAVVTVTALSTGARDNVGKQIESIGSNFIIVFPQTSVASGARGAQGAGARLTEDDGEAIAHEAVSVAAVAPVLRARGQVIFGDKNTSTSIIGTTLPYYTVRNWKILRGRLWEERDELIKSKTLVIGTTTAKNLFGDQDPVGQMVRIGRHAYTVTGVLESKGQAPIGGDQDDIVLMPIGSLRARVMRTPPGFAGVLMVSAQSADTTDRAVTQITSILRQRHRLTDEREPDFVVRTQKEFQAMQQTIYGLLTVLLVGVAAVSLVVGGIGVMNIMLVSVAERTREIGIRMAIGARASDIRNQFLVEAVLLSALGGTVGAAGGVGVIAALAKFLEWPMSLSPDALALSIGTSALTGVLFGFLPARRASRLDPIEALRHE